MQNNGTYSIVKLCLTNLVAHKCGKSSQSSCRSHTLAWEAVIIHVPSLVMITMVDEAMMTVIIMMDVMTLERV